MTYWMSVGAEFFEGHFCIDYFLAPFMGPVNEGLEIISMKLNPEMVKS